MLDNQVLSHPSLPASSCEVNLHNTLRQQACNFSFSECTSVSKTGLSHGRTHACGNARAPACFIFPACVSQTMMWTCAENGTEEVERPQRSQNPACAFLSWTVSPMLRATVSHDVRIAQSASAFMPRQILVELPVPTPRLQSIAVSSADGHDPRHYLDVELDVEWRGFRETWLAHPHLLSDGQPRASCSSAPTDLAGCRRTCSNPAKLEGTESNRRH